jgi:hypothetical protein
MWRQEMLSSILHGCHFDTISSFSSKNFVPDIFYLTSYDVHLVRYLLKYMSCNWIWSDCKFIYFPWPLLRVHGLFYRFSLFLSYLWFVLFTSLLSIAFPFACTSKFARWLIFICWWTLLQNALCGVTQATLETDIVSLCVLNWIENCVRSCFGSLLINIMMNFRIQIGIVYSVRQRNC